MSQKPKLKGIQEADPAYKVFRDNFEEMVADIKAATGEGHILTVTRILDIENVTKWWEKESDIAKREKKRTEIWTVYRLIEEIDRRTEHWHWNHPAWQYVELNMRHAKEFLSTGEYARAISRLTGVIMGLNLRK